MSNKRKIINDPVFGFIDIPSDLIYDLLQAPLVQRLSRIHQLGLSYFVYPGATHTRFLHSLGAMHLMHEAISVLRRKGVEISHNEGVAACAAILLHDIGHGPFSHVLEHTIVQEITHEEISLLMMEEINKSLNGQLDLAIRIFKDEYDRRFLHQLISSQLDVDRLDYLCRDSFFCGVQEGTVASARILKMLNVLDDRLVVESKGIYSIEKFLVARRLMYWQVYLHKTSVAAEQMLQKILSRAKELSMSGKELFASPALKYFLSRVVTKEEFVLGSEALHNYALLDDSDIYSAITVWQQSEDKILSLLCKDFMNRRLFKAEILEKEALQQSYDKRLAQYMDKLELSKEEASYLLSAHSISTDTYSKKDDAIEISYKTGEILDVAEASDMLNIEVLTKRVKKNYLFYYKL